MFWIRNKKTCIPLYYVTLVLLYKRVVQNQTLSEYFGDKNSLILLKTLNFNFLFQLFDKDNHLNKQASQYLFNTEGHIFPISEKFRRKPWEEDLEPAEEDQLVEEMVVVDARTNKTHSNVSLANV